MASYKNQVFDISCELKDETDKAWLIVTFDQEFWVPKSIGEWEPKSIDKVFGEMTLPVWFIEKEGIPV